MTDSNRDQDPPDDVLGYMYREIIALLESFERRGLASRPHIAFMAETATLTLLSEARSNDYERLNILNYMRERDERVGRMSRVAEEVRAKLLASMPTTRAQ